MLKLSLFSESTQLNKSLRRHSHALSQTLTPTGTLEAAFSRFRKVESRRGPRRCSALVAKTSTEAQSLLQLNTVNTPAGLHFLGYTGMADVF